MTLYDDKAMNNELSKISAKLDNIIIIGSEIGESLYEQNKKLDEISNTIDKTSDIMNESTKKISKMKSYDDKLLIPTIIGICSVPFVGFQIGGLLFVGSYVASKLS